MHWTRRATPLLLLVTLCGCGEGSDDGSDDGASGATPVATEAASATTTRKSGVTTWKMYRDGPSALSSVRGLRDDGTVEEELQFHKDADGNMVIEQEWNAEDGTKRTFRVVVDANDQLVDKQIPDTQPPCVDCMQNDLGAAFGGMRQSALEAVHTDCDDATEDAAIGAAKAVFSCFFLSPSCLIQVCKAATAYQGELDACL